MTGLEHYTEAERLLALARQPVTTVSAAAEPMAEHLLAEAQAHATLALCAAVIVGSESGYTAHRVQQWEPALGSAAPQPDPDDPWSSSGA